MLAVLEFHGEAIKPYIWWKALDDVVLVNIDLDDLGVSKNRGTPKIEWFMEIPIKMDDLGVPLFSDTPILMVNIITILLLSLTETSIAPFKFDRGWETLPFGMALPAELCEQLLWFAVRRYKGFFAPKV